jgi:hypothetical protein
MSCSSKSACIALPVDPSVVTDSYSVGAVIYKGTNQNEFQNFVGATGKASDAIPYVMAQDGEVVAFSASINGVNLLRSYVFYIVVDIPVGHVGIPPVANQLAHVELQMNEIISGTIVFSCRRAENGLAVQARASRKNTTDLPYFPIDAFATWTTIQPGTLVQANQALALYLVDKLGNEEAAFQIFIRTKIT